MAAAREMFVRDGFESFSMRKLAERIGYSPTTIYLYFRDRNDLLIAICEETFARLARNIKAIGELSDNPVGKLRSGLREYVHFGLRHPEEYTLVFISPLPVKDERGFENSNGRVAFDTLRSSVAECAVAGLLKNDDVELISQTLWAGIHGVTSILVKHPDFPFVDRDQLVECVIDTLIDGILR